MNQDFLNNIISMRGEEGKIWLGNIPTILKTYERKWGIKIDEPYNLTYNYVAPAEKSNKEKAVIKIGFPKDKEFKTGAEALNIFDGVGAVKILAEDLEHNVVLLERLEPGTPLRDVRNDYEQTAIFIKVVKSLQKQRTLSKEFLPLTEWIKGFERIRRTFKGETGPFDKDLFERAESFLRDQSKKTEKFILIHGDLHSDNILLSDRGYVAIDPKGLLGPKEYEVGAFLRNPFYDLPDSADRKAVVKRRILQICEELGFDKNIVLDFAFSEAILSAIWSYEDHRQKTDLYIKNSELLLEIKF